MNKHILILFLIIISQYLDAQESRFGLNFNIGIEKYRNNITGTNLSIDETINPNFTLGVLSQFFFKEKFFGEMALNYNYSHRQFTYENELNGRLLLPSVDKIQLKRNRKINYITLPVSVGYKKGVVSIKLGVQFLYTLQVDSESLLLTYYTGVPNPVEITIEDIDQAKFYVEQLLQIGIAVKKNLEIQCSLIHNSQNDNYDDLYPRFRFSLGIIAFLGKK